MTDITGASQTLLTSYSTISHFSPSSHPSLANLQTFLSTLLHTQSFVPALPVAMTVYNALTTLHPLGHPTRAIALAALGKLRIVGTNEGDEERYWRDEQGLLQTVQVLVQGLKEVEDSFGKGGVLGAELRELIRQTEEGLKMTRMARGLQ